MSLVPLPDPPFVAVVFTSVRTADDAEGYREADSAMSALASTQPGYLGHEGVRDPATGVGITVSYWRTDADARAWKAVAEHHAVQLLGRERWYAGYRVVVARVERVYGFAPDDDGRPASMTG